MKNSFYYQDENIHLHNQVEYKHLNDIDSLTSAIDVFSRCINRLIDKMLTDCN
jgi:hypothetical protein